MGPLFSVSFGRFMHNLLKNSCFLAKHSGLELLQLGLNAHQTRAGGAAGARAPAPLPFDAQSALLSGELFCNF